MPSLSREQQKAQTLLRAVRKAWSAGELSRDQIERLEGAGYTMEPHRKPSLAQTMPQLAEAWRPELNGGLLLEDVGSGSGRTFKLVCSKCGREYGFRPATMSREANRSGIEVEPLCKQCKMSKAQIARKGIGVRCVETGQGFESMSAAAAWLRGNGFPKAKPGAIRRSTKTGGYGYGYHWECADDDGNKTE